MEVREQLMSLSEEKVLDVILEHYKETNTLSKTAQKDRNKYFIYFCLAELILLFVIQFPDNFGRIFSGYFEYKIGIDISLDLKAIQSLIWVMSVYAQMHYYQRSVYIEWLYPYISHLEHKLSSMGFEEVFSREGKAYASNYPFILTVIHFFYNMCIPFFGSVKILSQIHFIRQ